MMIIIIFNVYFCLFIQIAKSCEMLIIFDKRKVIFATAAFFAGTELIAVCLLSWQLPKEKFPKLQNLF